MGVADIAEAEITLHHLHQVEPGSLAQAVKQIVNGREYMERDEEQCQRSYGSRNTNPVDTIRIRIFELDRKDREFVLGCESAQQAKVASARWIRRRDQIVKQCDAQRSPLHRARPAARHAWAKPQPAHVPRPLCPSATAIQRIRPLSASPAPARRSPARASSHGP